VTAKVPEDTTINTSSIDVYVTFSEPATGVQASDLVLTGDGAVGATVGAPADQGGNIWRFPVSGLTDGQVSVTLAPYADDIEIVATTCCRCPELDAALVVSLLRIRPVRPSEEFCRCLLGPDNA
jgi:hypothetical protein